MTMHLMPIYYNNNNSKKRKQPFKKPGWQKAQAEHDAWLKKMGVHPSQLKNKEKHSGYSIPDYKSTRPTIPTSDRITAIQGKKTRNVYTGTYVTGLATMHKSNLVPVGRGDKPEDYSKMRRS